MENDSQLTLTRKPHLLVILDGWGDESDSDHNAITKANTPNWDAICANHPHTLIEASGTHVGLPEGQIGNSEVGHMTIGAGRLIDQNLNRINKSIAKGSFFTNRVLQENCLQVKNKGRAVHLIGLLSDGGVHSHISHWKAMLQFMRSAGVEQVFLHPILDGRDTPPKSAESYLDMLQEYISELQLGEIVDICGRYYAMDRDKRYERTQSAFDLYCYGKSANNYQTVKQALEDFYAKDITDEFVTPTKIGDVDAKGIIANDDVVIFMNFRSDRAKQLCNSLVENNFSDFKRGDYPKISKLLVMVEYAEGMQADIIFKKEKFTNVLGECLAKNGKNQLRVAETEKYAHVTFFLNGGREEKFVNEDRILIPSPKVPTYDMQPEMAAKEITSEILAALKSDKYDVIICNFANADMLGHTGDYTAAVNSIECLDKCLGKLVEQINYCGGEMLITADHGNAEIMYDESSLQPHTAHTTSLVPFVYCGNCEATFKQHGTLVDVAPTLLGLMGLGIPDDMTGQSLLVFSK